MTEVPTLSLQGNIFPVWYDYWVKIFIGAFQTVLLSVDTVIWLRFFTGTTQERLHWRV